MTRIKKPPIGAPCNGCGLCCQMRVCMNGAYALGLVDKLGETVPGPCPALTPRKDGTFACGIVLNPKKYLKNRPYPEAVLRRNFSHLIGAGTGCDELGYEEDIDENEEQALSDMIDAFQADPKWRHKSKIALKVIHGIEY